ncbi:MAG TPA: serine protease [Solirubrobacterales bacterium]|nr:serine protease [Solirubrobacterales bacterium]
MKAWRNSRARAISMALACALAILLVPAAASAAPGATASIIGGKPGTIDEFPSLVYVQAIESKKHGFSCTGTVVAPRIVLTAAHCVEDVEKGTITPTRDYAVSTGVADPTKAGPENIFHIVATHVFPGFDPGVLHGDAAILVLDRPTTAPVLPMAGAADAALYAGGAEVRLTGWGLTSARAKEAPANLRTTTMLVQTSQTCRQKVKPFYRPYLPAAQVCVLAADRKSGGCFGDSGGPAIGQRPDGTPVQLGVTSTGGPACSTKTPTVLTRVDFVSSWVSEWAAATESGAPPPTVDPNGPLPPMLRESAEEFTVFTLTNAMGKRFESAQQIFGGCKKRGSAFRCEVDWIAGRNIYVATVSPFYLRRQEAVAWDSHYRVEWAAVNCIESKAKNRRCPIHKKRG